MEKLIYYESLCLEEILEKLKEEIKEWEHIDSAVQALQSFYNYLASHLG